MMILKDFIEQEIELGHIGCFEDFRESLQYLSFSDSHELDLDDYDKYLHCEIEWVEIKLNFNRYDGVVWYEIELVFGEDEE